MSNKTKAKEFDFLAKVLFLGDSMVGKTAIMDRFVKGKFEANGMATLGLLSFYFC